MKTRLLTLAFALASLTTLWAQKPKLSELKDVVYLKNGSIIRGQITEQIPNQGLKIESRDNLLFLPLADIEKITKEPFKTYCQREEPETGLRYRASIESGFTVGLGSGHHLDAFQLRSAHGLDINSALFVGLGTGLRLNIESPTQIPLFLRAEYSKPTGRRRPFARLDLGYAFEAAKPIRGVFAGFNLQTALGFKFKMGKPMASLSLAYDLQRATFRWDGGNFPIIYQVDCIGLGIHFGLEF